MVRPVGWLVALGWLASCGGGTTSPGTSTPIDFTFTDPAADTAVADANPGLVKATDLIGVTGRLSSKGLDLTLQFAEAISPWTAGAANALDGFVYFDVDQVATTGFDDLAHGIGVDFYLDLRDNGAGKVAIVDVVKRKVTTIDGTFDGTSFSVSIPLSNLTLTNDAAVGLDLAVVISNRLRTPVADSAPNETTPIVIPDVP